MKLPNDPYTPELGSIDTDQFTDDTGTVTKTGTTTVGLTTTDGVVIATDRRASLGGRFVSSKNVVKVEQIHPTAAMTLVGSVGGAQSFIRTMRAESTLYETRRDDSMSVKALATLAGNIARGSIPDPIHPIIGGVDNEGSHVFSVDPAGGVVEDTYTVTGSGMQLAYGTLEQEYAPDMKLSAARQAGTRAVMAAAEHDTGSGNGLALATITGDGVEIDTFEEYPDPADLQRDFGSSLRGRRICYRIQYYSGGLVCRRIEDLVLGNDTKMCLHGLNELLVVIEIICRNVPPIADRRYHLTVHITFLGEQYLVE